MEMMRGAEGDVLQMRTKDSPEKVTDWYVAQLKPTKHIQLPGRTAVLHAGKITAVITAADSETQILIKQESPW